MDFHTDRQRSRGMLTARKETLWPQTPHGRAVGPGGRPTIHDRAKVHVGFRLAADVVEGIKATGKGCKARVEKVLRAALVKGQL